MANGSLDARELQAVDGVQLAASTAQAFMRMRGACLDDTGVLIRIARPAGGYRSLWMQRDMRSRPAVYNIAPGMVPFLATPGNSTHGTGRAVDLTTLTRMAAGRWLAANCSDFGFTKPPPGDPNHFLHNGSTPAGTPGTPITPDSEHVMGKILFNTDDPNDATRRAFVGEVAFQPLSALASTEERMIWGDPVNVTGAEFAKFKARAESRAAQVGSGTLTAAQIAQISAGVKVPAVDLSAVLAAIRDLPAAVAQYVVNSIKGQWAK